VGSGTGIDFRHGKGGDIRFGGRDSVSGAGNRDDSEPESGAPPGRKA
jgi:hypothetical protein